MIVISYSSVITDFTEINHQHNRGCDMFKLPLTIMKLDRVCVIQMHGALPEYFLGRMPWSCHSPSIWMTAGSSNPPRISSQIAIPNRR